VPEANPSARAPGAIAPVRPFRMGEPDVVLLVSDSTNGVIEPCNCTLTIPGGLSRRRGLVRSYRAAFRNVLLLDAGDALRVGHPGDPRNLYLLQAYRRIGYDAVVLADHEWSVPARFLRELLSPAPPAFLSTSGSLPGEKGLPIVPVFERDFGGAKIAILADVPRGPPLLPESQVPGRFAVAPKSRLAEETKRLRKQGSIVVLATHGLDAEVQSVARAAGADLVLQGHFPAPDEMPARLPDPPVVRVGNFEQVSVFAWKVRGGSIVDFEYRRELVDKRWPLDLEVWELYEDYTKVALKHAMEMKAPDGMAYTPSATCGECHEKQYEAWKASGHAHAYATLTRSRREGDPDCLACHTTGFRSRTGFDSMAKTPQLANVNCQDCHGFTLEEHDREGFEAPPVEAASCTRCHTSFTDPTFDFETRRAKAACGR